MDVAMAIAQRDNFAILPVFCSVSVMGIMAGYINIMSGLIELGLGRKVSLNIE